MEQAQQAEGNGQWKKARKLYDKVYNRFPASEQAAEAVYRSGSISMERHKWKDALASFHALLQAYPESPHFNEVITNFFEIAAAYEEGRDIHYLWVFKYYDTRKAIGVYETLVQMAPYSDYAPVSLMRVAMLCRRDNNSIGAMDALDRIINNYPNSMLAADATLLLADYLSEDVDGPEYDQGATREAMSYYRDFLTLYPDNPAVAQSEKGLAKTRETLAQSKFILGEFFYKYRDDYTSAAVFFNDTITIAPESQSADKARDYLAKIEQIKARFPENNWPVRRDWQYLFFWRKWDPMKAPVPPPSEERTEGATPAPAAS